MDTGWIDMREIRNPEFRRELLAYGIVTVLLSLTGLVFHPACGGLLLLSGILFSSLHWFFARRRYRQMERLSRRLDRILHGQEAVLIAESREGELSILESELQKMTVRLKERSDRLTADKIRLTNAIADISHQIRTPLTAMNFTVSLLEEGSPERQRSLIRELKRQLERTGWLAETLLKLSKLDAGSVEFRHDRVPVRNLVEKASAPLRIPMELRGQTLETDAGGAVFTGDLDWTAEALGNLLKNCMEHADALIRVTASETALYTEILIEDDGQGFHREDIPRLFDRFYRGAGQATDGVGIGLAFSRSVVAAQNGTVAAGNLPGGGARFTVRFYKGMV